MFCWLGAFKSGMDTHMLEHGEIGSLIDRARSGDREAFDRLVEESRIPLRAAIFSRVVPSLRGSFEVDEVVQETFVRAYESLDRFRWQGPGSFVAWLSGIARNVIRKTLRKRRPSVGLEIVRNATTGEVSPSRLLRRDERFDRLEAAFEGLSDDHREVLALARIEGRPIKEIAERMRRSPDAVRHLLFRALKELRKSFGDTESLHLTDRRLDGEKREGGNG